MCSYSDFLFGASTRAVDTPDDVSFLPADETTTSTSTSTSFPLYAIIIIAAAVLLLVVVAAVCVRRRAQHKQTVQRIATGTEMPVTASAPTAEESFVVNPAVEQV